MSAVFLNIAVGLATSVISGALALSWKRVRTARILNRKAAFFGLERGGRCLVGIVALAHDLGCSTSMLPVDDVHASNGDGTEFCIGTPTSNPRTAKYLELFLPGVKYLKHGSRRDSGALVVDGKKYLFDRGRQEHALVAKFVPPQSRVRFIDNRAALRLLEREYRMLLKVVDSLDRFCLILRINSSDTYGHEASELLSDVTAAAFDIKVSSVDARPTRAPNPDHSRG